MDANRKPDFEVPTYDATPFSWGGPGLAALEGMCNASDLSPPGPNPGRPTPWERVWSDSDDVGFYLRNIQATVSEKESDVQLFVLGREHSYKEGDQVVTTHWTFRSVTNRRLRVQVCNE